MDPEGPEVDWPDVLNVVLLARGRCCTCNGTGLDSERHTCRDCDGTGIDNHGA